MSKSRLISILLLTLIVSSCIDKSDHHSYEEIQGEWILLNKNDKKLQHQLYVSFKDSICNYITSPSNSSYYSISNDTLTINQRTFSENKEILELRKTFLFQIEELNQSELILSPLNNGSADLFNSIYFDNLGRIGFRRLERQNNSEFMRIGLYSTYCFGRCPSMYLEIDKNGSILFNGIGHTEKIGYYSGKLDLTQIKNLRNWINSVDLSKLKKNYAASYTDAQTTTIIIETSNGVFKTLVYGYDEEPIELRILINELMRIYKVSELDSDLLLPEKIEFEELWVKSNSDIID